MIVKTITAKDFVEGRSMIVIPEPSEEIIEKFKKFVEIDDRKDSDKYLISKDHCSALITEDMSLDDLKSAFQYDERVYVGFWQFDGRWVRRKRHNGMNIGIRTGNKVYTYRAERLASILRVAGKKVHLYICRREEDKDYDWAFLLVLNDKCGICLAPVVDVETYEIIGKVARLINMKNPAKDNPSDCFFDDLSEKEALKLIERLSRELGILHV